MVAHQKLALAAIAAHRDAHVTRIKGASIKVEEAHQARSQATLDVIMPALDCAWAWAWAAHARARARAHDDARSHPVGRCEGAAVGALEVERLPLQETNLWTREGAVVSTRMRGRAPPTAGGRRRGRARGRPVKEACDEEQQ